MDDGMRPRAVWPELVSIVAAATGPVMSGAGFDPGLDVTASRTVLLLLFGLLAVVGGALAARYAASMLPWDAFGLLVAAAATALTWPVAREELPSAETVGLVLITVGLGLAFGSGLVLVTGAASAPSPGPAREPGGDASAGGAGVLVLGPAALLLGATALAPVTLRSAVGAAVEEVPSLTVPLFAGTGAVLLVLLFVSTRALDRVRREARAEAEAAVAARAS